MLAVRQLKSYVSWVQTVYALKRIAMLIYEFMRMIRMKSAHGPFESGVTNRVYYFSSMK